MRSAVRYMLVRLGLAARTTTNVTAAKAVSNVSGRVSCPSASSDIAKTCR